MDADAVQAASSQAERTQAEFAHYVATLGRGPGRSRPLRREEARVAFGMVLQGLADPMQVGAFLMLLRYRGEDPDEISGLVEAARDHARLGRAPRAASAATGALLPVELPPVDLDWPSYGAGRTRGAPWFLLSALALADSGVRVLMHGSNAFSGGLSVPDALLALGRQVQGDAAAVDDALTRSGFAYWPCQAMAPALDRLLGLRRLFGLRSPVNTVARLLDPADAAASVDGVFHPPYIALHLGVAERLARPALLVLKGGGGEAERSPAKATTVHLHRRGEAVREMLLPKLVEATPPREAQAADDPASLLRAVWRGEAGDDAASDTGTQAITATIIGTIAMALLAMRGNGDAEAADRQGRAIWMARRR